MSWANPEHLWPSLATGMTLAWLLPAQAQFWDWGNRPQRQQQQYNNNSGSAAAAAGSGTTGATTSARNARRRSIIRARPRPTQKKPEATTPIVVMGDANADWLAYGLEDAFSEKPEIGVVRKHRTDSGLIRYDARRDIEWPQVAREIIAAEKPKFIVMMIGNNDRQTIREKAPAVAVARRRAAAPKAGAQPPAQPSAPGGDRRRRRRRPIPSSSRPSNPRPSNSPPT